MDVFVCLAEHANEVVTRNQLLDVAWSGNTAFDEQLTRVVGDLRRALHDDSGDPKYIETVPKRGYRLVGDIRLPEGSEFEKNRSRSVSFTQFNEHKLAFVIIAALVLAIVYLTYDEFVIGSGQQEAPAAAIAQVESIGGTDRWEMSIAVLPFVNMSDDPGNEYFSDGLSEEIMNLLANVPGLKVIGRTSSFAFKDKNEDLRVIGQSLGVKTVLEGSVRKSGDRVRITAQLVDVSDGTHIWSESYDRTMTDIFAVQDDVAAAIINALQIHVSVNPTRGRPTESTEAYVLFLRARAALTLAESRIAEEILLKAIELDPEFAEAYELLAYNYWWQVGDSINAADGQRLTYDAAAKALAINPNLVFAQAMYQVANIEAESYLSAIEALERVVRKQPSNPEPLNVLTWDLLATGYHQEALHLAERYVDIDPLSQLANYRLYETLYAVGRTSEAVAALKLADQLGADFAEWRIGEANLVEKRDETAIAHFESQLQQYDVESAWVRELVAGARDPASGQAYLDRRIPQIVASMPDEDARSWQLTLANWYLLFGFPDRQFELILATDLTPLTWSDAEVSIHYGSIYRRLGFTAHPKYLEVAEALDFIGLWEQRGPPDYCEKAGGQWVCE
jgi:TolB-like protein